MQKKITYLLIYLFICLYTFGQVNFVPNPSFEDTIGNQCQSQMAISVLATPIVKYWSTIYGSTPDYYNTCANSIVYPNICTIPYSTRSYQNSHIGNAYIGIVLYLLTNSSDSSQINSEYISTKLKQPLKANMCYYAEFYANLGNVSKLAINQISLLLTQNTFTAAIGSFTNTIQPQLQWDTTQCFTDTLNWVKISGKFIAQGNEQYLTIGNFKDGTHLKKRTVNSNFTPAIGSILGNLNYILIDDVSLYELSNPILQSSYTICPVGDSLLLGDTSHLPMRYQWFVNGNLIDTTGTIKVKPNQTTAYVLQTTNCTTTTQSITVTYTACPVTNITEPIIPNVFTPNGDHVNDVWEFTLKDGTLNDFAIYSRWGNTIVSGFSKGEGVLPLQSVVRWNGRTTSGEDCNAGVYFYVLEYTDANGEVKKKNGYVSLIR